MFASLTRGCCVLALPLFLVACNWDFGIDGAELFARDALTPVPTRFAVGATSVATIDSDDPDPKVRSADPDIIEVEMLGESQVRIRGVGAGETSIVLQTESRHRIYSVEVAQHEYHEVLLVEQGWGLFPVTEIDGRTLLAGVPLRIVVALYDSEGLLYSAGAAELELPEASEECDASVGPFDGHCLLLDEGPHRMRVDIGAEVESLSFDAVSEADVANVVLIRDQDEASARPGDPIRVDALGLTADSAWVYGIPATATELPLGAPFAYTFDPSDSPVRVTLEVLGFERDVTIRGGIRFIEALKQRCYTTGWSDSC